MAFYSEIAPFYDDLFPVGDKQLAFLKKHIGKAPKQILDIACGNGGYAVALAKEGHLVTALDSDEGMLVSAQEKAALEDVELATVQCSMDTIDAHITGKFDVAMCIGNSLVHLDHKERVLEFLRQLKACLLPEGKAILQIINYNKVLYHGMNELPEIRKEEKDLKFTRRYALKENAILFSTTLQVNGKKFENAIQLLPLVKEEIEDLIQEAGFTIQKVYGGYDGSAYDEATSMHYIVVLLFKEARCML
ncbi:MAG: class I SAM-dependent methyltransferase [Cellulosilyticaceae bacterium]